MKQRITVQVFQNGEAVGEYVANVKAESVQSAVDTFITHARIDLRYRFLTSEGIVKASFPNDYLCMGRIT